MELTIRTAEGTGADLYRWLATDPPVRGFGAAAVPAGREEGDGTMGTGFDLLNLIVPNAIALGGLLTSLAAFIDQRRRATGTVPPITVAAGGVVVLVDGSTTPQALAAQIQQALQPPAPPAATPAPQVSPQPPPGPSAAPQPADFRSSGGGRGAGG